MENWDEIRTAFQVARVGTVSGAAEVLGVHHATVIRHIDALEGRLGAKLFQRHARGYTPTEAGQELLRVAKTTEDQFSQLAAKISGAGQEMDGELIITALPGMTPLVLPVLRALQVAHPALIVRYVTDLRVYRLEYGEAHVAIRGGQRPQQPDNVVQQLLTQTFGLFADKSYVDRFGAPADETELGAHHFVGPDTVDSRAPFLRWITDHVPREAVVFRSNDLQTMEDAVVSGAGIGFMSTVTAARHPDLTAILAPRMLWEIPLWLVTHVDLHRTPKVQAFLAAIKDAARTYPHA